MRFSTKDFFSIYEKICSFQRIWSNLLKKSLKLTSQGILHYSCSADLPKIFFSIDIAWRKSVWLPHIAHIEIHYRNGSRVRLICPITKLSFLKKIDTFYET